MMMIRLHIALIAFCAVAIFILALYRAATHTAPVTPKAPTAIKEQFTLRQELGLQRIGPF